MIIGSQVTTVLMRERLQTSDRNGLNCGSSNRNPDLGTYREGQAPRVV